MKCLPYWCCWPTLSNCGAWGIALPPGFAMAIPRVRDVSIVFNELLSLMMLMPLPSFSDKKILRMSALSPNIWSLAIDYRHASGLLVVFAVDRSG